jgi:hypothetical protein
MQTKHDIQNNAGHVTTELTLTNYSEFLTSFPSEWEDLSHHAYTPYRYFYLAKVQIKSYRTSVEKKFQKLQQATPDDNDNMDCDSYCFGFYVLIRTCLAASQKFTDLFQQKQNPSKELHDYLVTNKEKIQDIVDIANDKIKHPLEKEGKYVWYEPGGGYGFW